MRLLKPIVLFKVIVGILFTIIAAFQVEATSKSSDKTGVRRLQLRDLPTQSGNSSTGGGSILPPAPIQCGLIFFTDALGNGHSVCENFGGNYYNCLSDSCHLAESENSPKMLGNLIFKNCHRYVGDLGKTALDTALVDVLVIHLISYYDVQKLNPPIGTIAEWPKRVDVVGYNATSTDRTVASSRNYQCPLTVADNTVRPWCLDCSLTTSSAS